MFLQNIRSLYSFIIEKYKIYHKHTIFCILVGFSFSLYSKISSDPLDRTCITIWSFNAIENFKEYVLMHNYSSTYTHSILNSSDTFEFILDTRY